MGPFPLRDHASQPGRLPDEMQLPARDDRTDRPRLRRATRPGAARPRSNAGGAPTGPHRVAVGELLPHARRQCRDRSVGKLSALPRIPVIRCLGTGAGARARPARRRTSAAGGRARCRAARTAIAVMPLLVRRRRCGRQQVPTVGADEERRVRAVCAVAIVAVQNRT